MKETRGVRLLGLHRVKVSTEHSLLSYSVISTFLWVLTLSGLFVASASQPLLDKSCRWSPSDWFDLHGHSLDRSLWRQKFWPSWATAACWALCLWEGGGEEEGLGTEEELEGQFQLGVRKYFPSVLPKGRLGSLPRCQVPITGHVYGGKTGRQEVFSDAVEVFRHLSWMVWPVTLQYPFFSLWGCQPTRRHHIISFMLMTITAHLCGGVHFAVKRLTRENGYNSVQNSSLSFVIHCYFPILSTCSLCWTLLCLWLKFKWASVIHSEGVKSLASLPIFL